MAGKFLIYQASVEPCIRSKLMIRSIAMHWLKPCMANSLLMGGTLHIWHHLTSCICHTAYLAPGKHRTLHIWLAQDQTSSQWTLTCPRTRCQPGMLADYDWPAELNVICINFICWDMGSGVATPFPSWHLTHFLLRWAFMTGREANFEIIL